MRVSEVMSEAVESIPASAPHAQALELMRRQQIGHVAVIDGGALRGVVSRRQVERAGAGGAVRDLLSAPQVTASPHTTVREAANLMRGNHVDCLPVLDRNARVVGIVTASDLLELIANGIDRAPQDAGRRR